MQCVLSPSKKLYPRHSSPRRHLVWPSVWWPHGPNVDFLLEAQRHRSAASSAIPQRSSSHCRVHRRGSWKSPGHGTWWPRIWNQCRCHLGHLEYYLTPSSCKKVFVVYVYIQSYSMYASIHTYFTYLHGSLTHTDNTSATQNTLQGHLCSVRPPFPRLMSTLNFSGLPKYIRSKTTTNMAKHIPWCSRSMIGNICEFLAGRSLIYVSGAENPLSSLLLPHWLLWVSDLCILD